MSRQEVLSLYRQILKKAREIPSYNHRLFVVSKVRHDFHRQAGLTEAAARADAMLVGWTQLDNLTAQVQHMRTMMEKDLLVHRGGMVEWTKDEEATRRLEERQRKEDEERKRRMQAIRRQQKLQQKQTQSPDAQLTAKDAS